MRKNKGEIRIITPHKIEIAGKQTIKTEKKIMSTLQLL